jgi:zinc protease
MTTGIAGATRQILPNGMTVLVLRNPSAPTVSIRGELRLGAIHEPEGADGVAAFTAAALMRGAGARSFQQIVAETEERGCAVSVGGGVHVTSFAAKALAEDLPLVVAILADLLIRPTFPPHEIEKLRGQILVSLRERDQDTGFQAEQAARALLYPPAHPYSRPLSGTVASIEQLTRNDLLRFHAGYHPQGGAVVVVGDVEPETVIAALGHHLGAWTPAGPPPELSLPPVPPLTEVRRQDIAMPGKLQADLVWAVPGLERLSPDYYAAMLANLILGQLGMGGRLGEQVRERQGMAYYCSSSLEADLGAGPWSALAGVGPEDVEPALAAILHEVAQFTREGPTEQELDDARAFLTGSLALGLETNDGMAGTLLAIERYALGLDFIARYPALIGAISAEAITAAARRYLSTDAYVLAVAGPPLNPEQESTL